MLVHLSLLVLFPVTNPCYIRESKKGKKKKKTKKEEKSPRSKIMYEVESFFLSLVGDQ